LIDISPCEDAVAKRYHRDHLSDNTFALLPSVVGVAVLTWRVTESAGYTLLVAGGTAFGLLFGLLLSPDLDQETLSHVEWQLVKKTWVVGFVWLAYWWPYALYFKHRDFWTHFPGVGTALRLLYLGLLPAAALTAREEWGAWIAFLSRPVPAYTATGVLCGLLISDTLHWIRDEILGHRRRRRRMRG
jgi:uncharacterized metal-binding protein